VIKRIEIYRSGAAVWVVIDGKPLPADWIEEAAVGLSADEEEANTVMLTLHAETVAVDAGPVQLDAERREGGVRVPVRA
jgi:hypothetical protein